MEKDFQKDKKLNPYKEMKFKVYAHYLYGLIKPFAADDDISCHGRFSSTLSLSCYR